ncbi:carboxypeptidase-like regulatory domain-containing protein [Dokdonia sinensis]|uniref:Carboxypeptidase-like regulatory domain-containing protein n=2 Tax=Dokdonia sinensis TaxID=2479847 RepID=A0A3M0FVC6_9FLAO|nr:carboxypeptidase-like regulatory domain-containing protein [Dokdonia sinensis]
MIAFLIPFISFSQDGFKEVKGAVESQDTNKEIASATITIVGTNISTVTNMDGDFLLKVPSKHLSGKILIKAIGHDQQMIAIPQDEKEIKISLAPSSINLNEVNVVTYKNAKELVKKVFNEKRDNYLSDKTVMTAFYRETIKKRNKNASLAEAVLNIHKEPYASPSKDGISLIKSRKNTDYSRLDTIALKLQGGPFSTLYVDVMKYPEYIFTPETMDAYEFQFGEMTEVDNKMVYTVNFKQGDNVVTPLYEGKLYINGSSLALVKATYNLNITNNSEVVKMFVRRKPNDVRIKPRNISYEVNYRQKNGKWYYGYSNAELSFEVKKRKKLFKSIYTLSCEMAVTDWEVATSGSLATGENISESIIMADQSSGFNDPEFWGEYNVIEPEKSIESAIRKIQRRLEKTTPQGSGLGGK